MANLYVFDKDGTLVHPRKDGYVESPEDQVLYEGVRDKLDRLRSDGHALAIASNQGGCDIFDCPARLLKDEMIWHNPPFMDDAFEFEIARTFDLVETDEVSVYVRRAINPPNSVMGIVLKSDFICKVSHKTIEGAIAEMQYAADLCGITEVAFCPVMDGSTMRSMMSIGSVWGSCPITVAGFNEVFRCVVNFRKPHGGMLTYAQKTGTRTHFDRLIMIGDRDSDQLAAISAGFEFMRAEDWRNA